MLAEILTLANLANSGYNMYNAYKNRGKDDYAMNATGIYQPAKGDPNAFLDALLRRRMQGMGGLGQPPSGFNPYMRFFL